MRQETMMVVFNEAPASAKQAGVLHEVQLSCGRETLHV